MPAIALNIKTPAIFSLSQNSGDVTEETLQESINLHSKKLFSSYWHAGYKGSDHLNRDNRSLSMNELTRHVHRARTDYSLLEEFKIKTVRESVGWRLVEMNGHFDFSSIESRAQAANELGIQVIWTLCHYVWPGNVDVFSPVFIDRYATYCERTMRCHSFSAVGTVYSPMNEISFLTWAVAQIPCRWITWGSTSHSKLSDSSLSRKHPI